MTDGIINRILRNNVDTGMVYHYTGLESIKNILRSGSLWLSHVMALSGDKIELDFGIDYIVGYLSKNPLNKEHKGLLKDFGRGLKAGKVVPICVGSFCEIRDLKSQWKKFGKVAIGFRTDDLQKICEDKDFAFGKIIYNDNLRNQCVVNLAKQEEEDRKVYKDWFDRLEVNIAKSACFFKREKKYRDEHEVRILTNPSVSVNTRMKRKLCFCKTKIKYYTLSLLDEKGAFLKSEIVIGLDPNQKKSYNEVDAILKDYNITNCEVSCIT